MLLLIMCSCLRPGSYDSLELHMKFFLQLGMFMDTPTVVPVA